MKKTSLYNMHLRYGGRMVDFAGFSMPVQYKSILDEHEAVRNSAGIFDVSHMGEFTVKGENAALYLSSLIPTSMSKLVSGMGMYTLFCLENGGVIDDLFIFKIENSSYYLVVNASTIEKDFAWMKEHLIEKTEIKNISDSTSKIDIQGPLSSQVLSKIFRKEGIDNLPRFRFYFDEFNGSEIMISNTGYTGEQGYELFIENSKAELLWERLMLEGAGIGIKPAGLGARDTLRLESCYPLYGHEINENINPFEAGLSWLISSDLPYVGKPALEELKKTGAEYGQYCLELTGKGVLHEGYKVLFRNNEIGTLTSGIYSPTFRKGLALLRALRGSVSVGDTVQVIIRDKRVDGRIVEKPFYKFNSRHASMDT